MYPVQQRRAVYVDDAEVGGRDHLAQGSIVQLNVAQASRIAGAYYELRRAIDMDHPQVVQEWRIDGGAVVHVDNAAIAEAC